MLGLGVTALFSALLYLLLGQGIDLTLTPTTEEALTFWLGLPMLIYIAAGGVGVWRLNSISVPEASKGAVTYRSG